jgi:hypothetical protein
MKNCKIYYLTSSLEPDYIFYVGYTKKTITQRLKAHHREMQYGLGGWKKNNWIKSVIKKGGKILVHLLLENLTLEEAKEKEKEFIKFFKKEGFNLKNLTEGGECYPNTVESIYKRTRHAVGKKYSLGYNHTEEHKEKMRILNTGKKMSNEAIEKTIKSQRKPVLQLDITGLFIKEHVSLSEAERELNISKDNIIGCCQGKRYTCGGFKWKYKE